MMNILEQSEALKSVPEDALMREMQQPTGSMPQFLVLTELKRRKRVRDEYNRRQAQDIPTVAEEVVMGAGMPQEGIMQMSKSMAPKSSIAQNTGQREAAPREPTMGMATGGILSLAKGNKLGKPVVYNGKTYMVTDKGEVFLNRRRVANRKLRDAVREAASSPDAMTESIAPLGSDFIEGASPNVPTSISQVDFDATAEPITPPSLDPKPESVGEDALSQALRPQDPGRIGQIMDTTQAGLAAQAAMDPSMGALESTGARALSPEEVLQGKIDAMPEQLADQQAAGLLDKFKSGVASLADRFRFDPSLTSQPDLASFDISQLPPEEIQGIATRRGMPEGFSGDPRLQGGIVEEMRGTGMPAAALSTQEPPKSQKTDAIDFSNITAYPPTLSPMEIAARRNIAEQEATLPQKPLSIDATPPGFGAKTGDAVPSDFDEAMSGRPGIRSNPFTGAGASVLIEGFNKAFIPEKNGPLFPDGTADAETIKTETEIAPTESGDIAAVEAGKNIGPIRKGDDEDSSLAPETSLRPRARPEKGAAGDGADGGGGPSGTRSGTSGTGGSPLRSRIEELIADREKDREADKWMALAETGLALMASSNPTLGGAIGEAGLVGVSTMRKAKQDYDKDMLELLTIQEDMRQADLDYSASLAAAAARGSGGDYSTSQYIDDLRQSEKLLLSRIAVKDAELANLNDLNNPATLAMDLNEKELKRQKLLGEKTELQKRLLVLEEKRGKAMDQRISSVDLSD